MSDETQSNSLFSAFVPSKETTMPFEPAPTEVTAKRTRKPRTVKAAPAPKPPKVKRKPKPPKQPAAPEQVARPKFDLQTILRAASVLKDDDYPAFEPLLNTFNAMSKPQRERILAAIGQVFA